MQSPSSPEAVVQRQLDAYNAKDITAWLSTYALDAEQITLHGERLAHGHEEIRGRIVTRFAEPDLHAKLLTRTVMNGFVVDHELITRTFPKGKGTIEMLCVYELVNGLIQRASFALGEKGTLVRRATQKPNPSSGPTPVGRSCQTVERQLRSEVNVSCQSLCSGRNYVQMVRSR